VRGKKERERRRDMKENLLSSTHWGMKRNRAGGLPPISEKKSAEIPRLSTRRKRKRRKRRGSTQPVCNVR